LLLRSVNTILFVLQFHVLQIGPSISCPSFSGNPCSSCEITHTAGTGTVFSQLSAAVVRPKANDGVV